MNRTSDFKMGEIILIDIPNNIGHQQGGTRPAVIVSNNIGNSVSPMLKVLPITTKRTNSKIPTHVDFKADEVCGLDRDSNVEAESTWTINKWQVKRRLGHFTENQLTRIACAMVFADPIVVRAFENGILENEEFIRIFSS